MKDFTLLLAFLLLGATSALAQTFPVDTLIKNGPLNGRINLVFVGDGYQASEMTRFRTDVDQMVADLFAIEPFRQYQRYFNVFAIRVPSAQSGTTHPRTASDCGSMAPSFPQGTANTYFGTRFDNAGVHRAVVTGNQSALAAVLATNFPQYTQAAVIVNTTQYGGTGGAIATITAHPSASNICIHEMGHSFANLADEYWAGAAFANERANRTQPGVTGSLRWQSWVGQNGVGNYPYVEDPSWSKPHQNCKMQFLSAPFCAVCTETIIERIHSGARSLEAFTPTTQTIANPSQAVPFTLTLLRPQPNTLKVAWKRDGVVFGGNTDQQTVPLALLTPGNHTIRAEVMDTTTASHSSVHRIVHRYVVQWDIENTVTGTRMTASTSEYKVETFPNPVVDVLNLSYTLSKASEVRLAVVDAAGRRIKTLSRGRQAAGVYKYELGREELGLKQAGVYTLLLEIDGMVFDRKLVKE
ncbi:hypothetical protein GCM10023185_15200 [Hymenobacter saemangeumensis]|uniref:T9SS type A sorting domain-containing protein n=1 Tax=Hymenobacter saemangeumensis TaxID=1084522 RepID=A0ABP8I955_9BACT